MTALLTAGRVEPLTIAGPAGRVEIALEWPQREPAAIAVICHPHPLQQGTMDNKVVTTLARAFRRLGAVALRFNFRGVGGSEGEHAHGVGERDDALAAIDYARNRWPGLDLYLGGFSFGGAVALAIADRARPRGLVTVAPAVARLPADFVAPTMRWLLVQGDRDEVLDPAEVLSWASRLPAPPQLAVFEGVGHFFHGRLPVLAERVTEFFSADFAAAAGP